MLKGIRLFFHHMMDPHCQECNRCKNCELYREQLDLAVRERMKLLELLLDKGKPTIVEVETVEPNFKPITGSYVPWASKRRELEQAEREKYNETLKKAAQPDPEVVALEELILGEK